MVSRYEGFGTEDNPFLTISYAVSQALEGYQIVVEEGHYRENIIVDKALKIRSRFSETLDSTDLYNTIVDGIDDFGNNIGGSLFQFIYDTITPENNREVLESELSGFTLQNGFGTSVVIDENESITLSGGGGVFANSNTPFLENNIFKNNGCKIDEESYDVDEAGAVLYIGQGNYDRDDNTVSFKHNKFQDNCSLYGKSVVVNVKEGLYSPRVDFEGCLFDVYNNQYGVSDYWVASDSDDVEFDFTNCSGDEDYELDDCVIGIDCPEGDNLRDGEQINFALGRVHPGNNDNVSIKLPSCVQSLVD